jgi:hypothetical protein
MTKIRIRVARETQDALSRFCGSINACQVINMTESTSVVAKSIRITFVALSLPLPSMQVINGVAFAETSQYSKINVTEKFEDVRTKPVSTRDFLLTNCLYAKTLKAIFHLGQAQRDGETGHEIVKLVARSQIVKLVVKMRNLTETTIIIIENIDGRHLVHVLISITFNLELQYCTV